MSPIPSRTGPHGRKLSFAKSGRKHGTSDMYDISLDVTIVPGKDARRIDADLLKNAMYRVMQNGGERLELGGDMYVEPRTMAGEGISATLHGSLAAEGMSELRISVSQPEPYLLLVSIGWSQPSDVVSEVPDLLTGMVAGLADKLITRRCVPSVVDAMVCTSSSPAAVRLAAAGSVQLAGL